MPTFSYTLQAITTSQACRNSANGCLSLLEEDLGGLEEVMQSGRCYTYLPGRQPTTNKTLRK